MMVLGERSGFAFWGERLSLPDIPAHQKQACVYPFWGVSLSRKWCVDSFALFCWSLTAHHRNGAGLGARSRG